MLHSYRLLGAALLGLALLAGCGGDPKPLYAAPSSSGTPSSPAPTTSAVADPQQETPEQFIRRWFDLSNRMQNSGATSEFDAVSDSTCVPCTSLRTEIAGFYKAGGSVNAGGERILSIRPHGRTRTATQLVVTSMAAPSSYRVSAGAPLQRKPGGKVIYLMTLIRVRGHWVMQYYNLEPQ